MNPASCLLAVVCIECHGHSVAEYRKEGKTIELPIALARIAWVLSLGSPPGVAPVLLLPLCTDCARRVYGEEFYQHSLDLALKLDRERN